jgi:DNA invertase Pin-like site-specific DNA recombinase
MQAGSADEVEGKRRKERRKEGRKEGRREGKITRPLENGGKVTLHSESYFAFILFPAYSPNLTI